MFNFRFYKTLICLFHSAVSISVHPCSVLCNSLVQARPSARSRRSGLVKRKHFPQTDANYLTTLLHCRTVAVDHWLFWVRSGLKKRKENIFKKRKKGFKQQWTGTSGSGATVDWVAAEVFVSDKEQSMHSEQFPDLIIHFECFMIYSSYCF